MRQDRKIDFSKRFHFFPGAQRHVYARVDDSVHVKLKKIAEKYKISKSRVVRELIRVGLEEYEKEESIFS